MSYTLTDESVTVVVNGKHHTFGVETPNYHGLAECIYKKEFHRFGDFLTVESCLTKWLEDTDFVTDEDGDISYKGKKVPKEITDRMTAMASGGESPMPILYFYERLQRNPSYRSVNSLFPFLMHEGIPIDVDGTLLTYKSVTANFLDHHTKTVDNSVGSEHEMPRNEISDDPYKACHVGFHSGALSYAKTFGGEGSKIVICRVDPEHVVCVPIDCNAKKVRMCKYNVIGHYTGRMSSTTADDEGAPTKKGTKKSRKAAATVNSDYAALDAMGYSDLKEESLDTLRKYGAHHIKLVGASKIPGGKPALISKILEVRG